MKMCQRSVSIMVMEAYVVGHPNNELVNVDGCIAAAKFGNVSWLSQCYVGAVQMCQQS